MAIAAIETRQAEDSKHHHQQGGGGDGLRHYYQQRIQDMQLLARQKDNDLQRLEAQRNDLNSRGSFYLFLFFSALASSFYVNYDSNSEKWMQFRVLNPGGLLKF